MSDYSKGILALKLEDAIKEINKKKQSTSTGGNHPHLKPNSAEADKPMETRDELAKIAGIGGRYYYKGDIQMILSKEARDAKNAYHRE